MTRDHPDVDITTEEQFNEAIKDLLNGATQNGINVLGGWPCRNGDTRPDWEVVVVELDESDTD